jgi:hypothetical protein
VRRPVLLSSQLVSSRLAAIALISAFAAGCGDACDDELDKAEECNIPLTVEREEALDECDDLTACEAECAADRTCETFTGDDPAQASQFLACLDACGPAE